MKKYLILTVALVCSVMTVLAQDKYTINRNDLPEPAQKFLTEYFPKSKVSMVKTDRHLLKKTDYDVKLVDGSKIEFNNSGKWTTVDCNKKAVPDKIIIRPIRTYVKNKYPDEKIVKIKKTSTKFEVKLSNKVELNFNLLGQFKSEKKADD